MLILHQLMNLFATVSQVGKAPDVGAVKASIVYFDSWYRKSPSVFFPTSSSKNLGVSCSFPFLDKFSGQLFRSNETFFWAFNWDIKFIE